MRRRRAAIACLALAMIAVVPAAAFAKDPFAPLDRRGPALTVPKAKMRAALECQDSVRNAKVEPVLLNPATGVTPDENYSWNWEPELTLMGIPWCAYHAPSHTLEDITISGEYLVFGIRRMYRLAGRPIAVMGHSQGGMSMRWPLRFWPSTRRMVHDVIGFAGSNHGSDGVGCSTTCPASVWQQGRTSNFIAALNSRAETFKGIDYTNIYSHTDEVVTPNADDTGSSSLHTGRGRITNVATQDLCPLDVREHLLIGTIDPVAHALAVDALTHDGPADKGRIPGSICGELLPPGVDPTSANMYLQLLSAQPGLAAVPVGGVNFVGVKEIPAEPELPCYVYADCRKR
ncbi:MAG: hypothetical protein QOG62_2486 [Thermoleophilaceae bacterium]|jgi:hypothetical protein|nr:hypothetical protein [Thermoleophilaceae bacterium]